MVADDQQYDNLSRLRLIREKIIHQLASMRNRHRDEEEEIEREIVRLDVTIRQLERR